MIDRSKPLPIHEFPSLISEVARLKELEGKATPGECIAIEDDDRSGDFLLIQNKEHWAWKDGSNSPDAKYIADLRNATPALLDVLGEIRAGDAGRLDAIIEMIDFSIPSELMSVEEGEEEFDIAPSEYQEMIQMKETLHRYRDIAKKMEANR